MNGYIRYNPSKRSPGRPWEFRLGKNGRLERMHSLAISRPLQAELKASPGKWFNDPH